MIYPWFEFATILESFVHEVIDIDLSVLPNGVFVFNGVARRGAYGKTCWYIPLSYHEAKLLGVERDDIGLKVIRYPVYNDIKDEHARLLQEFTIQKILFANDMAPDIFKILLIRNGKSNSVSWLGQKVEYPVGSVFFALLVANVNGHGILTGVKANSSGGLSGPKINSFCERCRQLRIAPYDLTMENLYEVKGHLGVLDVHKWRRTYGMRFVNVPKYLQIELNNTCNGRCGMCAIPHMIRPRGIMSDVLFEKILKEADALGVEYVTPFLHGEPFMRQDFVEKLHKINECVPNAKITIFTNASMLDENKVAALCNVKNIDQIVFSFPGGNKQAYEDTTGLNFENSVFNIKRAFRILKDFNLRISMPRSEQNRDSENDFAVLWNGYPHSAYDTYNYLGDARGSLAPCCYEQCDRAFRTMTVLFDGRVCLCCMDAEGRFIMGDLSKESIIDVWNGKRFMKLREEHGCCRLACEPCRRCTQDLKTEEYNDAYHSSLV